MFDWFDAREKYTKDSRLSILNLDVDYYFSESIIPEEDRIHGIKNYIEYDIALSNASSGLQSITPLIAMVEYLTKWIYSEDKKSFDQEERQRTVNEYLIDEKILNPYFNVASLLNSSERNEKIKEYKEKLKENNIEAKTHFDDYKKHLTYLFSTQNSQFIIDNSSLIFHLTD